MQHPQHQMSSSCLLASCPRRAHLPRSSLHCHKLNTSWSADVFRSKAMTEPWSPSAPYVWKESGRVMGASVEVCLYNWAIYRLALKINLVLKLGDSETRTSPDHLSSQTCSRCMQHSLLYTLTGDFLTSSNEGNIQHIMRGQIEPRDRLFETCTCHSEGKIEDVLCLTVKSLTSPLTGRKVSPRWPVNLKIELRMRMTAGLRNKQK